MTAFGHRLLSDADLEPVSDAQLQAAIAVVAAMTNDEFYQACRRVGRKLQADPKTLPGILRRAS